MPRARDIIIRLARLLVRIFFRSVEVEGLEHVPRDGGGIIVSWHPNALVDPVLILACMPRPVVFGARSGLFRWPLLGWLMRSVGTVPIHRTQDRADLSPEDRHAANLRSLDALAKAVADGGFSCLFPEGDSHDAPHLLAIKTGAARFYYRARLLRPDGPPPAIIPVGLHYDAKRKFRSEVLVRFHPPLELPPSMDVTPTPDEAPDRARGRVRQLTASIEQVLREVVHATESWELHHHMHRASKLLRAERAKRAGAELGRPSMLEREVGFWRMWAGYHRWRELEPELTQELVDRVARYEEKLRALGMEDHELDRSPTRGRWHRAGLLIAQVITAFVVFPSLIFLAGAVNLGPYLIIRYEVDPLIPAAPVQAAIVVVLLSVAGGAAGIHYLRLVRETARALRVRITRARQRVALAELRVERSELADLLERSEEGVDLPGAVTAQGKVIASEQVPPGGKM